MPPTSASLAPRALLEERFARLLNEVEPLLAERDAERDAACGAEARERGRSTAAEQLNQSVRRLRQASGFEEIAATLVDAAGAYATGVAVLRVAGGVASGQRIRGVDAEAAIRFAGLAIPLSSGAALAGAVATKDPVVAVSTADEISVEMLAIAGHGESARVCIFPVANDEEVTALLYCWGAVQPAAMELLAQVAGLCIPVAAKPAPAGALIGIAPAASPSATASRPGWDKLPLEEQRIHLRAQRFARVQIAELRLHQADAVHAGRLHRDLYGVLRDSLDKARDRFGREFIAVCPSMVDYLHLELVRTLAHDNPGLLGTEYPGPLV
jgi:hypothetical protein